MLNVRKTWRLMTLGISMMLVGLSVLLMLVGQAGPTLLFWSNLYAPEWLGVGKLPMESWQTLSQPGTPVYSDHAYGFYWTQVAADNGDFMVAVGPEGLAIASASNVTANWEGVMRSRALIPHSWILGATGATLALSLGLTFLLRRRNVSVE